MKFLFGEGSLDWLERMTYRGGVGLFYDTTWQGVLTYLILGTVCIFALIGLCTVIKWIFVGIPRKKKSSKW